MKKLFFIGLSFVALLLMTASVSAEHLCRGGCACLASNPLCEPSCDNDVNCVFRGHEGGGNGSGGGGGNGSGGGEDFVECRAPAVNHSGTTFVDFYQNCEDCRNNHGGICQPFGDRSCPTGFSPIEVSPGTSRHCVTSAGGVEGDYCLQDVSNRIEVVSGYSCHQCRTLFDGSCRTSQSCPAGYSRDESVTGFFCTRGGGSGGGGGGGNDTHPHRNSASQLQIGRSASGSVSMPGDVNYTRVTLSRRMFVTIQTTGGTDTVGRLENSSGGVLITNDDGGSTPNFSISGVLEPGTYYIRVSGYENTTGNYMLTTTGREPRDGDPVISSSGGGGGGGGGALSLAALLALLSLVAVAAMHRRASLLRRQP